VSLLFLVLLIAQTNDIAVPDEIRAKYVGIIDSILIDADLTTISVKQVRSGIQENVQYDITPHKVSMTATLEFFH
jgi:DEK C terminal domain